MTSRPASDRELARVSVPPVCIGEVPVHPLCLSEVLEFIDRVAASGGKAIIHYANAHAVNLAGRNDAFRGAMREASLVFCDGKSLQWAARLLGGQLPERFTPPDWIDELSDMAVARSYRLFFLGAEHGVAKAAAVILSKRHPELQIATHHGYFERESAKLEQVVEAMNAARPDIVLVGLGMPDQELWSQRHAHELTAPVIITVGGLFDFVSQHKRRGPRWLTSIGLEWLTRLLHEPRRLGSRYVLGNPRFVWRVIRQALGQQVDLHHPTSPK